MSLAAIRLTPSLYNWLLIRFSNAGTWRRSMHKMDDVGQTRSYVRNEHLLIRECLISDGTRQSTFMSRYQKSDGADKLQHECHVHEIHMNYTAS